MANKRIRKKHSDDWGNCPLCGKKLPPDPDQRVIGITGRAVCAGCMAAAQKLHTVHTTPPKAKQPNGLPPLLSPSEVIKELDQFIVGQEEAKQAVVMALWKQLLRARGETVPKTGLLLYGPTGCGKTELIRQAARIMGLPFLSFDATSLSESGYRGRDAAEMVKELVRSCGKVEQAAHGVIFLDEIDKIAARRDNEHRAAYCRGTQYSLLKLIEGMEMEVDGEKLSTEGILFLFGGAFTELTRKKPVTARTGVIGFEREVAEMPADVSEESLRPEDFVAFGMEAELMGRVGRCVRLRGLTESQLKTILLESKLSAYRGYQEFFRGKGRELSMVDDAVNMLVKKALARDMGARGLNALVEEWVESQLTELAEVVYEQVG